MQSLVSMFHQARPTVINVWFTALGVALLLGSCSNSEADPSSASFGLVGQELEAVVAIDFKDQASPLAPGFLADYGQAYGARVGGFTYGWVTPGTSTPANLVGQGRARTQPADMSLATFMHMQKSPLGSWELAVVPGAYLVKVTVGDSAYLDSVHGVRVEGVPTVVGFHPDTSDPFQEVEVHVQVSDGRLTVDATGTNTKITRLYVSSEAPQPANCGDGTLTPPEGCDDGNAAAGDGCSPSCEIEPPSPGCGNARVESGEDCDDGNTSNGDGCSGVCIAEPSDSNSEVRLSLLAVQHDGWTLVNASVDGSLTTKAEAPGASLHWIEYSFGGTRRLTRARINEDNSGSRELDQWTVQITNGVTWVDLFPLQPSTTAGWHDFDFTDVVATRVRLIAQDQAFVEVQDFELYAQPLVGVQACGNGVLEAGEACDDHNAQSGDGCSSTCVVEVPVCGNGIIETGETCDDGNRVTGDGCSSGCVIEVPSAVCGNGVLEPGELCDDGNLVSGDGCDGSCSTETPGASVRLPLTVLGQNGWTDAAKLTDSILTTRGDRIGSTPAWIEYDLGGPKIVTRGRVNEDNAGSWHLDFWNIQYWDGSSFRDAFPFAPSVAAGWNAVDFPDVATSRIRLVAQHTEHVELFEFEVYGYASAPAVPTCGNSIIEGLELCDDGNLQPADGCSPACTIEIDNSAIEVKLPLVYTTSSGGWSNAVAAFDGNVTTLADKESAQAEWLEFQLGAPFTLTRARLNEDNSGSWNVDSWALQYWDGSSWQNVFAMVPSSQAGWNEVDFPNVVADRVRLLVRDANHVEVFDFELYGLATSGGPCIPQLSQFHGQAVSPLACPLVKVTTPYVLEFGQPAIGVPDSLNRMVGMTMALPPPSGEAIDASGFMLDTTTGALRMSSSLGTFTTSSNDQKNALGVGLDLPNANFRIETRFLGQPAATGANEQAGLWFGISQKDFITLTFVDTPTGPVIRALREQGDAVSGEVFEAPIQSSFGALTLTLEAYPQERQVRAFYRLGTAALEELGAFDAVPAAWFSIDAAGIDFRVGTRSFAGLFVDAGERAETMGPVTFSFDRFIVDTINGAITPPIVQDPDFRTWQFAVPLNPTAMVYGPDDRLYVGTVTGMIYAFTLDHERQVVTRENIATLNNTLLLGLAIDPASTPDDVTLWAGVSDVDQGHAAANSGRVVKLSGPGLSVARDVIVGLPRAVANHSTNHIHFGADGKLYIAQGGNTGAGASNDGNSEFGPRPEQPLSAALLVADVFAPSFDGDCRPAVDANGANMDATGIAQTGIACDVEVYASGLRNSYDFVFHSNGEVYATDNGLGVEGTFPELLPDAITWDPVNGCEGPLQGPSAREEHNPGTRPDLLFHVVPGAYHGHPNPSRSECIFFGANPTSNADHSVPAGGGSSFATDTSKYPVGVQPEANYIPPMYSLGYNRSSNGIIEYESNAFCGVLRGDLLITYFSSADQVRRVTLSPDGQSVTAEASLGRTTTATGGPGLNNPLPLVQDWLGRLYVGEFGANRISVFEPVGPGCWQSGEVAPLPVALLDSSGAAIDEQFYVVGGRTSFSPQDNVYRYSPRANTWTQLTRLPNGYPAVESPGVAVHERELYVVGGLTTTSTGAVANAAKFNPRTNAWTNLAPLPAPRGGAGAQIIQGKLYLVGGMAQGVSRGELFIYDIATNTWSSGAPLPQPRDSAMSAVFNGSLYVFGGRTQNAPGFADVGALDGAVVYSPLTNTWTPLPRMPTARRMGAAAATNSRIVVFGGEGDSTFPQTEVFNPSLGIWDSLPEMPTARHGSAVARIGNGVYVAGGGPSQGSSFTSLVEVLHLE
jgi:cysteine-rich repeat protein